jgi:hypothetical protein
MDSPENFHTYTRDYNVRHDENSTGLAHVSFEIQTKQKHSAC